MGMGGSVPQSGKGMQRWSEVAAVGTRSGAGPPWTSRAAAQRSGDVVEHATGRGAAVGWPMRRSGGARPPQSARAAARVYIINNNNNNIAFFPKKVGVG